LKQGNTRRMVDLTNQATKPIGLGKERWNDNLFIKRRNDKGE
jgi:hypothetical protein